MSLSLQCFQRVHFSKITTIINGKLKILFYKPYTSRFFGKDSKNQLSTEEKTKLAEIRQKVFEEKSKTLYNIKQTFSLQSAEGDNYLNKNTPVDAAMQDLFEYIKDKQAFDNAAQRIIFPNMAGKTTIQPYTETKSTDDKIDEILKYLKLNRSYLEKIGSLCLEYI